MHLLKHAPRFSPEQARDLAERFYELGPSRVSGRAVPPQGVEHIANHDLEGRMVAWKKQ
jgi:hypothetical protein